MHFFSFFNILPSAPTTTGMTLMLIMFYILLISLFSSWYLSIFSFSFSLTLMSPGIAISIMAQLLSFLFTKTLSGFLALIFVSHWIISSHKSSLLHFQQHPLDHIHTIFHFFSGCISHTISNNLFLQHYCAFSCTSFVPTFHIHSQ